jgi:ubiquinone/menaquinone biosynthesis C-methylase UbiE
MGPRGTPVALVVALAFVVSAAAATAPDDARRDAELLPERVMDVIGIRPGMVLGEAGAGHGYFTFKLARRVGPTGRVYANDIDGNALEHVRERCRDEGVRNIETVLGRTADPRFPARALDLVMMVYALHDFAEPQAFLEKLKDSLRPGATVVILDRDPEATGERHFMTRDRLLALFAASGYTLAREERFVQKHLLLVFRRAGESRQRPIQEPRA